MKDDQIYLKHVLEAILKIEKYVENISEDQFMNKEVIQDACIRQIMMIGEAVKQISDELKNLNKDVYWKQIAGMRDKLIHDYLGVDLEAVWETIK